MALAKKEPSGNAAPSGSASKSSWPLDHLDREAHLLDPARKQEYVNAVFDTVAGSYDRFTRLCSFGMDVVWKRELVRLVRRRLRPNDVVADLATGTGDLAFSLAPFVREGAVIGIDICDRMLHLAEQTRRRRGASNVTFRQGDLMATGLADCSVAAVTVGYGLRNCPDYRLALCEIRRVLRPGGILASLDFVRPERGWWGSLFRRALLLACNFYGWLWHGQPAAYGYLAHSIPHFASRREFSQALTAAGFDLLAERPKLGGAVCLHMARKRM
ncbi:MAG TPA: ubiquinone/menaquinone biosynthesis methyltransferase [Pirellulales bacterium]|nr:ubiquinone/menaquinone biosynthesis methyltransferase [Pirellulales bacterium]